MTSQPMEAENYTSAVWCFCTASGNMPMLFYSLFLALYVQWRYVLYSFSCRFLTIFPFGFWQSFSFLWICCDRSWIFAHSKVAQKLFWYSQNRRPACWWLFTIIHIWLRYMHKIRSHTVATAVLRNFYAVPKSIIKRWRALSRFLTAHVQSEHKSDCAIVCISLRLVWCKCAADDQY